MAKICVVTVTTLLLGACLTANGPSPRAGAQEQPAIPPEMKVLEKRVGVWKTITHIKPAAWTPDGGEAKGDEKIDLVLGGRFIQGRVQTQPGNVEATWLGTYDAAKKEYRFWYFSSQGDILDATGKWDASSGTLTWTSIPQPGVTSVARWRFTGDDTFEWDLVAKDRGGKVYLDMVGKLTRSK